MALPLAPFFAGLAVGSAVTYGYKDKSIHDSVVKGAHWLCDTAAAGYSRLVRLVHRPGRAIPGEIESRVAELERAAAAATETIADKAEKLVSATGKAAKKAARTAKSVNLTRKSSWTGCRVCLRGCRARRNDAE